MKKYFNTAFLLILLILAGLASFEILRPYLTALVIAFIFAQFFKGTYLWFLKKIKGRKMAASLITCILVLLIFIVPLVGVVKVVIDEANQFIEFLSNYQVEATLNKIIDSANGITGKFGGGRIKLDLAQLVQSDKFIDTSKQVATWLAGSLSSTYKGIANFVFLTFVMFFALYYFLKDGDHFWKKLKSLSPLKDAQEDLLLKDFVLISRATLKGSLVIAIIQGILTGFALWIAGVPAPFFLGLITIILSLVPLLGSALVWLPAGVIMLILGSIWQGIFLILFGALVIAMIDNFLRPILVGNTASLHPLLVFLSTLGGIALFGIFGFILGPIVIVLFLTLLKIYQLEFKSELKAFNK